MDRFLNSVTGYVEKGATIYNSVKQPAQVRETEQTQIAAANPPPPSNNKVLVIAAVALGVLALVLFGWMWKKG